MKLAVLGDIHGNHLALAAVLDAAHRQGAERLLITGDFVGYYFWSAEALSLLRPWKLHAVRGNHEQMLIEARRSPHSLELSDRKYGSGLRSALETLTDEQIQFLENLPHPLDVQIDGCRILLCHGAPWDLDHYLYPDAVDDEFTRCAIDDHDWVILGHTHYSMERHVGRTRILNPGSVGQPRDRRPGAHWALLDTTTATVVQHCESYDIEWIATESRALQPDMPYLWKVLTRK